MQPQQGDYWQPQAEAPLQAADIPPSPAAPAPEPAPLLSWQASEYVHHEKQFQWFLPLIGGAGVLLLISLFVIQSLTFALLIVVMTIALAVYAVRPPRIISYRLSDAGIKIDEKPFGFHDFRYFGIIQDGPIYSALLIPNKRFLPPVSVYFPVENGEQIVDILGSHLPMQKVHLDFIEKLTHQLRF